MDDLQSLPHYAHVTRLLIALYRAGDLPNVAELMIEPNYGHVGRIVYRDGTISLYRGGRTSINPHGSSLIAKDKGYSKYFLRALGYNTSHWATFITEDYAKRINALLQDRGKTAEETPHKVLNFIAEHIGYPCYLKPNEGSQGWGVYRCENADDVASAIGNFIGERVDVFIVEGAVDLPDYRVVIFDGECFAAYGRRPLVIEGDGQRTIAGLLAEAQVRGRERGRKMLIDMTDTRILNRLARAGYQLGSVLPMGETLQIQDVANLSLGGAIDDVTLTIDAHWRDLCVAITRDMGLRLCGLDLACADITQASGDYSIIEVNASPGLENYASLGEVQSAKVRNLYRRIFNEMPH